MVIHNGVAAREEPAGEGHSIDVLQVGNFFPVKNHAEALEAIRLLRIGGLPLRVVFLGGGTGRPRVQRIAEASGVSDQVGFAGEQDARAFFRYARVVIAPSVYEGCPLNVLEAMGSGCAVVASDIPGHREIAERWPQLELYPLGRPDILARKIKEALRHRQSGRVYSAIPPEYTWRSTLDAYERLFARALGRTNEPLET
jgi:glycosyltransferase involved in cell wall biosynthesis